tara:strand:+ start:197 stop:400 length:204 start_codon:yes stop_codon:yes gene_type:complete
MQHGIGDGQRTKQTLFSTIFAFAPSSYNTTLPLTELGQQVIVPQVIVLNMQLTHGFSILGEPIFLPS